MGKSSEKKKKASEKKAKARDKAAEGTPCYHCLKKCTSKPCKTWCHAHWCTGATPKDNVKKEILEKLRAAKREQRKAANAMHNSKKSLDADMRREKKAAAEANSAVGRAAKKGDKKDMKEANKYTKQIETDKKKII